MLGRRRMVAVLVGAGLFLSACIGATDRLEFQQVIRDRGGGVTVELFTQAIAAVEERAGTDSLVVRRLDADPMTNVITMTVRDPDQPQNLDNYTVRRGVAAEPSPVSLSAGVDLDESTFELDRVAFDRIEAMADEALERFGADDAWVDRIDVSLTGRPGARQRTGEPVVTIWMSAPRADAVAEFTGRGVLVEVEHR